jgi:hypothetical protein
MSDVSLPAGEPMEPAGSPSQQSPLNSAVIDEIIEKAFPSSEDRRFFFETFKNGNLPSVPEAQGAAEQQPVAKTSKQQSSFFLALEHRRLFYDTLKKGNFPLLPNAQGTVDATPAVNLVNNTVYHGPNVLILKAHQAAHGFPSAEYVSETQLEEASRRAGLHGTTVPKPHAATLSVLDPEHPREDGKPAVKFIRLYNVAEAAHPEAVRELARAKSQERADRWMDWQAKKRDEAQARGTEWEVRPYQEGRRAAPGPAFKITKSDPEKYLGQVFAAMSLNSPCKSDTITAAKFTNQVVDYLYAKSIGKDGKEHDNPYLLYQLGHQASKECKEIIPKVFRKPEQQQKQNRSAELSMS